MSKHHINRKKAAENNMADILYIRWDYERAKAAGQPQNIMDVYDVNKRIFNDLVRMCKLNGIEFGGLTFEGQVIDSDDFPDDI